MASAIDTWLPLLGLATATLACASLGGGAAPVARPDDFSVTYDWYEGSLPPPYHYEYTVSIAADGAGQVVYTPDYPGGETPTWTEDFALDAAQLDALYAQVRDLGVLTTTWSEADDIPVGGSHSTLTIVASGKTIDIPAFPARMAEQADSAKSAVYSAVPAEIWDRLAAQRDQYVQEHQAP